VELSVGMRLLCGFWFVSKNYQSELPNAPQPLRGVFICSPASVPCRFPPKSGISRMAASVRSANIQCQIWLAAIEQWPGTN